MYFNSWGKWEKLFQYILIHLYFDSQLLEYYQDKEDLCNIRRIQEREN